MYISLDVALFLQSCDSTSRVEGGRRGNLMNTADSSDRKIDELMKEFSSLKDSVSEIFKFCKDIGTKVDTFDSRTSNNEGNIDKLGSKLDALGPQLTNLTSALAAFGKRKEKGKKKGKDMGKTNGEIRSDETGEDDDIELVEVLDETAGISTSAPDARCPAPQISQVSVFNYSSYWA